MVTIDQLKHWDADRLGRVADELHDRRSALTDLADDVTAGRPPTSWVGGASVYAEQDHDKLADQLTDQVAELNLVISAIDAASGAVRSARTMLDDALSRASSNGCTVSADGSVRSTRTFDDEDERDDAQQVVDQIAQALGDALSKASEADVDLAASLRSANGGDVDAAGGLEDQTLPDALRDKTPQEQVDYLIAHPDLANILMPSLPGSLKEDLGQGISDLVDKEVNNDDFDLDQESVDRLSAVLDAYGSDSDVAAAMYDDLGADGTVATMGSLESYLYVGGGGDPDKLHGLADDLRRTLGTASQDPQFDSRTFGEDLTHYATWQLGDDERDAFEDRYPNYSGNGASILTYLMGNHHLDGDLVEGAAVELDHFERALGDDGAQAWYSHTGQSMLTTEDHGGWYDDPMAATLGNLGDHPDNAYDFLTDDPSRQDHYFHDRSWEADGFAGINGLAEGVGTDPDLLEQHPQETAGIVSRFFHGIATNDSFSVDNAEAGSPALAELMKHYTPAIDGALLSPTDATGPGVQPLPNEHLGDTPYSPVLMKNDLRDLMQVAVSTDDGATSIAEGIGGYQQAQLNVAAADLAADPDNPAKVNEVKAILQSSGALNGMAEHAVGSVEIADAKDHDARVQAFSDLVGDAAGLVPLPGSGLVGDAVGAAWSHGVDLGTGALTEAYGNTTDAVAASAETRADIGSTHVKISAFLSLAEAGVIPDSEIPDMWRNDSGGIISASDIPAGELTAYGQSAGDGVDDFVSPTDLTLAYKNEFLQYYADADD